MTVQFAVGDEPLAIGRGRVVTAWLHVRIDDTAALSAARRSDVGKWLAGLGLEVDDHLPRLVVSRDIGGHHQVHLYRSDGERTVETRHPVELDSLPRWLREPTPEGPGRPRKLARLRQGR